MAHWQDHFDRISFYMTLYYKMTKRRERRIRHMVFRWINVRKSNVYWPHYVKFSFSILYMYMYQVKKDKDGAETDILSNLKNGIIWSMYLSISNQRLEGEGQPRPLTVFRTTMILSIIFVKNRILNWLIVTWQLILTNYEHNFVYFLVDFHNYPCSIYIIIRSFRLSIKQHRSLINQSKGEIRRLEEITIFKTRSRDYRNVWD